MFILLALFGGWGNNVNESENYFGGSLVEVGEWKKFPMLMILCTISKCISNSPFAILALFTDVTASCIPSAECTPKWACAIYLLQHLALFLLSFFLFLIIFFS